MIATLFGVQDLCDAIENHTQKNFELISCVINKLRGDIVNNFWRLCYYSVFPCFIFYKNSKLDVVIGWQQFYAINYALYSRLFHTKRAKLIVVLNFTYRKKRGLAGFIYRKYIQYVVTSPYIDYLHVLSSTYAKDCCKELGVPFEKFVVTGFGVPDIYSKISTLKKPCDFDYCLSVGRSNRDFDFLVRVWEQGLLKKHQLVIISDTWKHKTPLPKNIYHYANVRGEDVLPWIVNCEILIIPIDNGSVCSGDTVLLTSMMTKRPVVVTKPSTLAEMYVEDDVDGICISKDEKSAAQAIVRVQENQRLKEKLSENARRSYVSKYSRYHMGEAIAKKIFCKKTAF